MLALGSSTRPTAPFGVQGMALAGNGPGDVVWAARRPGLFGGFLILLFFSFLDIVLRIPSRFADMGVFFDEALSNYFMYHAINLSNCRYLRIAGIRNGVPILDFGFISVERNEIWVSRKIIVHTCCDFLSSGLYPLNSFDYPVLDRFCLDV